MTDAPSEIVDAVRADLRWVEQYWPGLSDSRLPGTRRPWRQMVLTVDQRAQRDLQARVERAERVGAMPGVHAAPVDVGVLDLMTEILAEAEVLAWEVFQSVDEVWPGASSTAFADARPYLAYAERNLGEAEQQRPGLAGWAAPMVRRLVAATARALCMVYDGQALDVVCPWCGGLTAETPAGGAKTWRVRELPGAQIAIVCEGACEPPMREVGTWWRGQPCWPISDWERLAKRVEDAEVRDQVAPMIGAR